MASCEPCLPYAETARESHPPSCTHAGGGRVHPHTALRAGSTLPAGQATPPQPPLYAPPQDHVVHASRPRLLPTAARVPRTRVQPVAPQPPWPTPLRTCQSPPTTPPHAHIPPLHSQCW